MATPAAVLAVMVKAQGVRATNAQLASVQGNLQKTGAVGARMGNAIDKGMKVAAAGVAYGLFKGAQAGIGFEKQLDSLGAVTEATGRQMKRLEKQALKLGEKTAFSAGEAAQAQTELAKGGIAVRDILKGGLPAALSLAAAGELELAEAAEVTVNALKLFELRGKDAGKVADVMATAANRTTADVADFALALKQGGSAAKQAGLDLNQTMIGLEALAEAGIKGSDAGTSLKASLIQLLAPSEKQTELAAKLGLEWTNRAGEMKNMAQLSAMLRAKTDEMTKAERTQAFAVLAGTDGFRTLAALYDAGPAKLKRLSKANLEHGTAQEVAKRKMDNTAGSVEELLGSLETLAIKGFKKAQPAIRSLVDTATGVVNDIGRVLDDDSLSFGQKIARLVNMAVPAAVSAGGRLARAVGEGFVTAWSDMNLGARLFAAAAIIRLVGGRGAVLGAGAAVGRLLGIGIATGAASSVAGGGGGAAAGGAAAGGLLGSLRSKLVRVAGRAGLVGVGVLLGDQLLQGIGRRVAESGDLFKALKAKTSAGGVGSVFESVLGKSDASKNAQNVLKVLERIRDKSGRITLEQANQVRHTARFLDLTRQQKAEMNRLLDVGVNRYERMAGNQRKAASMSDQFARNLRGLRLRGSKDFDGLVDSVVFGSRNILRVGGEKSKQTREEVSRQFRIARHAVKQAMRDKIISVEQGTARLRELARKELKLYGISAGRVNVVLARGANGEMRPNQRGGYIADGAPYGDSVPALLERGEGVINRKAVRAMGGPGAINAINSTVPRFQKGGIAGMVSAANRVDRARFPYQWGGGHQASPAPFGPFDCSGAVSYVLQQGGVKIPTMVSGALAGAGKPGPGRVTVWADSGHTFMAINGRHFGTSGTNPGGGAGWFPDPGGSYKSRFSVRHFDAFGDMGSIPRVVLQGPSSVALEAGQGALDRVRSAANRRLGRIAGNPIGSGDRGDPGPWKGINSAAEFIPFWNDVTNLPQWASTFATIVPRESGWDPRAENFVGLGHRGWYQFDPPTWAAFGKGSWGNAFDPLLSTRAAGNVMRREGAGGLSRWAATIGSAATVGTAARKRGSNLAGFPSRREIEQQEKKLANLRAKPKKKPKQIKRAQQILRKLRRQHRRGLKLQTKGQKRLRKELQGFEIPAQMTRHFERLGIDAEDQTVLYEQAETIARVEEILTPEKLEQISGVPIAAWPQEQLKDLVGSSMSVLTQGELDDLVARQSKIRDTYAAQLAYARDRLVPRADSEVSDAREFIGRMVERAKDHLSQLREHLKRVDELRDKIRAAERRAEQLRDAIERVRDKKKKTDADRRNLDRWRAELDENRAQRANWGNRIETLTQRKIPPLHSSLEFLTGERHPKTFEGLSEDSLIGGARAALTTLRDQRKEFLEQLRPGGLPAMVFQHDFNVNELIREGATKPKPEQIPGGPDERGSEIAELERQLRIEAQQRLAVSEAHLKVFRGFNLPFMGAFAEGGVALVGERGRELVHMPSGSRVHSAADTEALLASGGGGGGPIEVFVVIEDGAVDLNKIRVTARDEAVRAIKTFSRRASGRPMPGRGGGNLRG